MSTVFNAQSFLKESNTFYDIPIDDPSTYKTESFFCEGLDFIMETHKELIRKRADLYRSISESGTNVIAMHESFTDFFGYIKDFIKKVINFFKKLLAKFWVRINQLFMTDKYIEKHKDELKKFTSKHEFTFNGFEYTLNGIPTETVLETINESMDILLTAKDNSKPDASRKFKEKDELTTEYNRFIALKNSGNYLDKERGDIISKSPIDEADYKDELFRVFRNDDDKKTKITATSTFVNQCMYDFEKYDRVKTSTERHKDALEKQYKAIQKKFDIIHNKVFGAKDDTEITVDDIVDNHLADRAMVLSLFAKEKAIQVEEVSNLHIMAFTAKLDALKEKYAQDKAVLYQAFKKILAKEKMFTTSESALEELEEHSDIDSIIDTHVRDAIPSEEDGQTDKTDLIKKDNDASNNSSTGGECDAK